MKVYELLDSPEKWTHHQCRALSADGYYVDETSRSAVRYSFRGAILKCYGGDFPHFDDRPEVLNALNMDWFHSPERTFSEVQEIITKLGI